MSDSLSADEATVSTSQPQEKPATRRRVRRTASVPAGDGAQSAEQLAQPSPSDAPLTQTTEAVPAPAKRRTRKSASSAATEDASATSSQEKPERAKRTARAAAAEKPLDAEQPEKPDQPEKTEKPARSRATGARQTRTRAASAKATQDMRTASEQDARAASEHTNAALSSETNEGASGESERLSDEAPAAPRRTRVRRTSSATSEHAASSSAGEQLELPISAGSAASDGTSEGGKTAMAAQPNREVQRHAARSFATTGEEPAGAAASSDSLRSTQEGRPRRTRRQYDARENSPREGASRESAGNGNGNASGAGRSYQQQYRQRSQQRQGNGRIQANGQGYASRSGDHRRERDRSDQQNNNGNRRQRHNQQRESLAPKANREELEGMKVSELRDKAAELGIESAGLKKAELVDEVYRALVRKEGFFDFHGILDVTSDGFGFVRTKGYLPSEGDIYVDARTIRSMGLRRGDELVGVAHAGRQNDKYASLNKVTTIDGMAPEEIRDRPRFGDLTPVFPNERLKMEHGKDSILGRCIDLCAPIGKGQRGLIVSPPKAGKTTVLKSIAASITANNPEVHLICLLVDERPEEVTDMQRSIKGEVVASTFDMPSDNHITVSELVIERAKRLVELGQDVVILLDSITRLARAYNMAQPASGRILTGGVDSTALYPPKRFLGAARNIENGGSLTILASALVETGSKMDEVIFEEFKGTGNMELRLDRDLADRRIFPAIDPVASGTRKEELLIDPNMTAFVWGLRRILASMNNNERAMTQLIRGLKQTETNEEFLIRCARKAQMQELSV